MASNLMDFDYPTVVSILLAVIGILVPALYLVLVMNVTRRHHRFSRSTFENLDSLLRDEKRRRDGFLKQ
jgi:hypothetical protein